MLRTLAKSTAQRLGVLEQIRDAKQMRTAHGRRNRRDDRNMQVLMAAVLGERSNAIDIGANVGDITASMLHLAPAGHHIAVEPVPALAAALRERFPQVDVHAVALSDAAGTATFHLAEDAPALSGLKQRAWMGAHTYRQIAVDVARLDDLVPEGYVADFIKIDVEGAHVLALRGAERVLSSRPVIWLDHGMRSAAAYGTSSADAWDLLVEKHGYRLFTADGAGPLTWPAFSATDHDPLCWTFIARGT